MSQHADRSHNNNHMVHGHGHQAQQTLQALQAQQAPSAQGQHVGSRDARILRQDSISRTNRTAVVIPKTPTPTPTTTTQRRPIPSPLHSTQSYRAATASPDLKSPTLASPSPRATRFPVTPLEQHQSSNSTGDKAISPIGLPQRAATSHPSAEEEAFEEIKAAAARDALLEEAARSRLEKRKRPFAAPIHSSAASDTLPMAARRMPPSSQSQSQSTQPGRPDLNAMHRTASVGSTASSLSSSASQTFKQPQTTLHETITPHDIAAVVASAGSAEAAILKLLQEKQQVATQTDQMWRIMEKQRAMIFGLKSDVERATKKKDEYRKKLKEQVALSAAGHSLATALKHSTTTVRADSQSPTTTVSNNPTSAADDALSLRKTSDATDVSALTDLASRSSTPQYTSDSTLADRPSPASSPIDGLAPKLQHAPLSASSLHHVTMPDYHIPTGTPPLTPGLPSAPQSPRTPQGQNKANASANANLMTSPQSFSTPKDRPLPASRKGPPAPLNLSPQISPRQPFNGAAFSGSEYREEGSEVEDGDDDEEGEDEEERRGRQMTRDADDRQREALAMQEHRSQSKREKKSKSKSAPPTPLHAAPGRNGQDGELRQASSEIIDPVSPRIAQSRTLASMVSHLRSTSDADAMSMPTDGLAAAALMSPGLPMTPRPGDRPMNSPMPRAPKQFLAGMPMSPRDGGMPLSPRAPRGPIPLPPQKPLLTTSTHAARAEAYDQLNNPSSSRLGIPGQLSPEPEPSFSSASARSPGEIYRGLVSDQYPGLLLPPNALPSIFIKVDSSRLRPSRNSYMAPRQSEENPVFTLAIFARSDESQLWRVEKTLSALSVFDQQIKIASSFRTRLPDRGLFTGHAPARIDSRRLALSAYFDNLLDTPMNDEAATIVCSFLTADAFAAESPEYFPVQHETSQPIQISVPSGRSRKDGYLTKRGKNFGGWKARYFVLDGPHLKYFEAPGGALLGSIRLPNAQIGKQSNAPQSDEDVDNQYRHAFLILEPKRKDSSAHVRHVLCAESDEERDAWVECLLQYVDDETDPKKLSSSLQAPKEGLAGGRSPRLQKSMNDLNRPSSSGKGSSTQGSLRSVPYQQTIAAEAPVMGTASLKGSDTPSPPMMSSPVMNDFDDDKLSNQHPMISGPTNATVIQDAQSWGNRPAAQTPIKDKKRSIFGFGGGNRGRASSDTASGPMSQSLQNDRSSSIRPVFGVPLAEAVDFSAPVDVPVLLPAVAYRCIEYLKAKDAISEEGIFRLSGSNIVIKALRERFNTEGDINLLTDDTHYDIHAVASLLKQYLRELPANILTREMHFEFLRAQEQEESVKVEACNVLVNRLPRPNRELLESLTGFLREIVDNERVNKMSVRNVGIVFAPTLNIPATLISLFVTEHARIFGPPVDIGNITLPLRNSADLPSDAVRSPRKQMFSDLPTPAYTQTNFAEQQYQQALAQRNAYDTGFIPMQPTYSAPPAQNDSSGYGSLNDALAPPVKEGPRVVDMRGTGVSSKQSKRESSAFFMNVGLGGGARDNSARRQPENEGGKF